MTDNSSFVASTFSRFFLNFRFNRSIDEPSTLSTRPAYASRAAFTVASQPDDLCINKKNFRFSSVLEAENLPIPNLETKPDEYDSYQCTLSPKFKDIAKDELREDESLRTQSLTQFREWIAKHPNIKRCRTGKTRV